MDKLEATYGDSPALPEHQPNTETRFLQLKQKFAGLLQLIEQKGVMIRKMRIQDDKLMLSTAGGSEADIRQLNAEIDRLDPKREDIEASFQSE